MGADGDYKLELEPGRARLSGVMRLVSPAAYRSALAEVHAQLESSKDPFEFDISGLVFLNSSGITALSRLVMQARVQGLSLTFLIDEGTAWQKKTLPSLARLYPKMALKAV